MFIYINSNFRWAETSSQTERLLTIRVVTAASGVITLLLTFFYSQVDQALHLAALALPIVSGPLLAIFLMGFFLPFIEKMVNIWCKVYFFGRNTFSFQGVSIGLVSGLAVNVWIAVGAAFTHVEKRETTEETAHTVFDADKSLQVLYIMTDQFYPLIGLTVTVVTGISGSLLSRICTSTRPPPHLLLHQLVRKKDPHLSFPTLEHAWTSHDAHYRWPSPSLPPTLKKPRPSMNTLTLSKKGKVMDSLKRRRKEDSWRSHSMTGGVDNDSFDSWGEEQGGGDYGTWESKMEVNYKL